MNKTTLEEARRTFYALEGDDRMDFQATLFREYEKRINKLNAQIGTLNTKMSEMENSALRTILITIRDVFNDQQAR